MCSMKMRNIIRFLKYPISIYLCLTWASFMCCLFICQDVLLRMPGVTFKNFKLIMNNVENLRALADLSENQLTEIMGNAKQASVLYNFIHRQKSDIVHDIKAKNALTNTTWKKRKWLSISQPLFWIVIFLEKASICSLEFTKTKEKRFKNRINWERKY